MDSNTIPIPYFWTFTLFAEILKITSSRISQAASILLQVSPLSKLWISYMMSSNLNIFVYSTFCLDCQWILSNLCLVARSVILGFGVAYLSSSKENEINSAQQRCYFLDFYADEDYIIEGSPNYYWFHDFLNLLYLVIDYFLSYIV